MRYKKIGEVKTTNPDVLNCLSEKFMVISENEDDEGCINYYIVTDVEPPPPEPEPEPQPEPEPPKKRSIWDIIWNG